MKNEKWREETGLRAVEKARSPSDFIDVEHGLVDRKIFTDEAIYKDELRRIFGRAWNFMCHESQLPEVGSFFMSYIGEDQVIAVRDREGVIQVLINTCPHRGNTVCRAEQGKTRSFMCAYHGWNFDLNGDLIGVPGLDEFYRGGLKREEWGISKAAKVQSYKGFVFATLDPQSPDLDDYLGWVGKLGLDLMGTDRELVAVPGVQKNRIRCNWKLAVDNLFDWYHPKISHASAIRSGFFDEKLLYPADQMVMLGEYGHAVSGPKITMAEEEALAALSDRERRAVFDSLPGQSWRFTDSAAETLGPVGIKSRGHPNIFPNLWVSTGGTQLCLRVPRGPAVTELWWFTFVDKNAPEEQKRKVVRMATHFFGPAGLLEQDDGENWNHSTRTCRETMTSSRRPLNFAMGKGQDMVEVDPSGQSRVETVINEHAQLWLYRSWADWMEAEDWPALIANHAAEPRGRI